VSICENRWFDVAEKGWSDWAEFEGRGERIARGFYVLVLKGAAAYGRVACSVSARFFAMLLKRKVKSLRVLSPF